jgi:hypothetical protein
MVHMSRHRSVTIKVRTGVQTNGHKAYMLAVPWQIAEVVPPDQHFTPRLDSTSGSIVYDWTGDPPRWLREGDVHAAIIAAGVPAETCNRIGVILRHLSGAADHEDGPGDA